MDTCQLHGTALAQHGTGPVPGTGTLQPTLPLHPQAAGGSLPPLAWTTAHQEKPGLAGGMGGRTGRWARAR